MPASYNPPWGRGSSARRASQSNPNLRVSHAERTAVADRLSKHYGDGRLDEEEFNERIDRAMKAKTQADLDGLFADLPDEEAPAGEPKAMVRQQHRRPLLARVLLLVLLVMIASAIWHSVTPPFWGLVMGGLYIPWLLIGLVVFLLWRSGAWHRRRP